MFNDNETPLKVDSAEQLSAPAARVVRHECSRRGDQCSQIARPDAPKQTTGASLPRFVRQRCPHRAIVCGQRSVERLRLHDRLCNVDWIASAPVREAGGHRGGNLVRPERAARKRRIHRAFAVEVNAVVGGVCGRLAHNGGAEAASEATHAKRAHSMQGDCVLHLHLCLVRFQFTLRHSQFAFEFFCTRSNVLTATAVSR
jgi:hypothetical protein